MKKVNIQIGIYNIIVVLRDTKTAQTIYDSCPINSDINKWGKELYFYTQVNADKEEDSKQVINKGELAFWVEGSAVAIGYGPTPASVNDEIRLVTDVNIFGDTDFNLDLLEEIKPGEKVTVNKS